MRIVGRFVSFAGLFGVVAALAAVPVIWLRRRSLAARSGIMWGISEAGSEAASTLTDTVATWLRQATDDVEAIAARADTLARTPDVDGAAASDLATAIDAFIAGPYAGVRTAYGRLRERALAVDDMLEGIRGATPVLPIGDAIADRLRAFDARMLEIDASMTRLGELGAGGLAEPGVAAAIGEEATSLGQDLESIAELLTGVRSWLAVSDDRVDAARRRSARVLTVGAVVRTVESLAIAGLNLILFRQGRRWSRG